MSKLQTSWHLETIPEIIEHVRVARHQLELSRKAEDEDGISFASAAAHIHEVRLSGLMKSQVGTALVILEEVAL